MLRVVVATRMGANEFVQRSPLAASVNRMAAAGGQVRVDLRPSNRLGLSEIYNDALRQAGDDETLLFVHDDVLIDDWFLPIRLEEALARFDVVGLVGNRRRHPRQGSWPFTDLHRTWDQGWLSGAVAHGGKVSPYGPAPAEVKLLDGLFLAVKATTLKAAGVTFDPQFTFDFYDLDFCRSCEAAKLSMGTWPIAADHLSVGNIGTPPWYEAYERYLKKWGE